MCGIHGLINFSPKVSNDVCSFIKEGFVAGSLRGMDSTGIYQIDKAHKAYMHKRALAGSDFVNGKLTEKFCRDADTALITIGHCRAATQGKVSDDNAHPFYVAAPNNGAIMGVHNGTINGWSNKEDGRNYDVDSEWCMSMIGKYGIEAFKEFNGAYAFVWWDSRQKDKVFIARNDERPLHFQITKDNGRMLIASEAGMLAWLAERNKIPVKDEIYSFDSKQLYSLDLTKNEFNFTKEEIKPRPAVVYNYNNGHTHNKSTSFKSAEDTFLEGISEAASEARGVLFRRQNPGNDQTTQVIDDVVEEIAGNEDVGVDVSWQAQRGWFSAKGASREERKAAQDAKLFGEIHWNETVYYDEDSGDLYGDIKDYVPGNGHITYTSLMRNVSPAKAAQLMQKNNGGMHGKTGDWAVVIGMHETKYGTEVLLASLNTNGYYELTQRIGV